MLRRTRTRRVVVKLLAVAAGSVAALLVLLAPLGIPALQCEFASADDPSMPGGGGGNGGGSGCSCVNGHCSGNCPTTTHATTPPTTAKPGDFTPPTAPPQTVAGSHTTTKPSSRSNQQPSAGVDFVPGAPAGTPSAQLTVSPLATTGLSGSPIAQVSPTNGGNNGNNGWAVGGGIALATTGALLGATTLWSSANFRVTRGLPE